MTNQLNRYYLFAFLKDFSFFGAVLVPFFTEWGGLSQSQVQILQSWFMLWFFLLEVPTGAVADYLGRKYSLALGALTVSVAAVLYGSIPSYPIFLLAEFLFAMAMSLISGADQAWVYDTLKEQGQENNAKKVFGRAESFRLLALFLSAGLGGLIARQFGLNAPIMFSAIPFLLAAFVAFTLREPHIHSVASESKRYLVIVTEGVSYLFHHKVLRLLALDSSIVFAGTYFVIWLYQPMMVRLGVPVTWFGLAHAFLVLMQIIVSTQFVRLEKIFERWTYQRVSAAAVAIGFILLALYPNLMTILLFLILSGGFGLTRVAYMNAKMNPLIDSDKRATVLSAASMLRRFGLVILNPIIGLIADQSLRGAMLVVGCLPIISLVLFKNYEKN